MHFPEFLKTIGTEKNLPILETFKARDLESLSYRKYPSVYAELAEMYLLKEDLEASKKYAKLGLEKLSLLEWVVQSEPERISRLKELAG